MRSIQVLTVLCIAYLQVVENRQLIPRRNNNPSDSNDYNPDIKSDLDEVQPKTVNELGLKRSSQNKWFSGFELNDADRDAIKNELEDVLGVNDNDVQIENQQDQIDPSEEKKVVSAITDIIGIITPHLLVFYKLGGVGQFVANFYGMMTPAIIILVVVIYATIMLNMALNPKK